MEIIGLVIALLTLCGGCFITGYNLGKDISAKADKKNAKIAAPSLAKIE